MRFVIKTKGVADFLLLGAQHLDIRRRVCRNTGIPPFERG